MLILNKHIYFSLIGSINEVESRMQWKLHVRFGGEVTKDVYIGNGPSSWKFTDRPNWGNIIRVLTQPYIYLSS